MLLGYVFDLLMQQVEAVSSERERGLLMKISELQARLIIFTISMSLLLAQIWERFAYVLIFIQDDQFE